MRWLYIDPANVQERRNRESVIARIDSWWREFESRASDLDSLFSRQTKWDLVAWMQKHLQAIDPHLMWEFGPARNCKGHRLVITPEAKRHLRPMLYVLLDRAPKLAEWEFYPNRIAEDYQNAVANVRSRIGIDPSDFLVAASVAPNNAIALQFCYPSEKNLDSQQATNAAFMASELCLGEEMLEQWIGEIRATDAAPPSGFVPLSQLKVIVDLSIESVNQQLPGKPIFALQGEEVFKLARSKSIPQQQTPPGKQNVGQVFKRQIKMVDDYPAWFDLFVASSRYPDLWLAAHQPRPFVSRRFSRSSETFCYLKIDGRGADLSIFPDRASMEKPIDAELTAKSLGCVIAGGTGRIYSYSDLALVDVPRAMEVIRQVLQRGNVSKRSWLLFYDAELLDEWLGVWPDTPDPPT